jgi:2-methylcitrate dehydratase PrpD
MLMPADPAHTLAAHVCRTTYADLPEEAVVASKRDILDTLGAALGGSVAPGIAILLGLIKHWGGRAESSVLLEREKVPAPQAALVNAAMGHALDFDDTLDRAGSIHPGTSVFAVSFAVAETLGGVSGRDLLLAVTLGLDVSCRVALAATVDRGWHRTAAMGIFGATAAAGKLLGLSVEQMVHAFGIAYSQAAGNRQCILDGALTKRLQAGQAASSAVLAAVLARDNFTGAHQVFAGRYGFFPMYQFDGYHLAALDEDLGTVFRGVELSFKPYPCGRPTHAALDVALELYRRLDLASTAAGAEITEILVTTDQQTYENYFRPGGPMRHPTQVVEAQFSLPFLIAAALALGKIGIREVAQVDDARVLALTERISGASRADASKGWTQITVRCADGRMVTLETSSPSGSPERPLSDMQLAAKFRDCAAHAARPLAQATIEHAIDHIWHLDKAIDATELLRLFCN